jgi:hypothetical protein
MRQSETPPSVRFLASDPAIPLTGSWPLLADRAALAADVARCGTPTLAIPPHRDPDVMCIDLAGEQFNIPPLDSA